MRNNESTKSLLKTISKSKLKDYSDEERLKTDEKVEEILKEKKREYINVDIFYWQLLLVTQKEIPADNKYLLPKIKVHFWISEQYPLSRNCNLVLLSPSSGYKTIVC